MSSVAKSVNVAIIGAGPAGASAAIELARAGRSVILFERHRFPREKVCGGCLSGPALIRLKKLLGREHDLPGVAGTTVTFIFGACRITCQPRGATWMAPRAALDACLAQAASLAGADVRFGEMARLEREHARWNVAVKDERIHAETILVAGGLGGLSQSIGVRGRKLAGKMIAQQWVQPSMPPMPPLGAVELHWLRGGYVGLATLESGGTVVALAVRTKIVAGQNAFHALQRLNPRASIWTMLPSDAPQRYCAKGTTGFPWIPERLGDANVLLVGDASGYAEPFSGTGIGQAVQSAHCAANAILGNGNILEAYTALMRPHRRHLYYTRTVSSLLDMLITYFPSIGRFPISERLISRWVESVHVRGAL